MDLEDMMRYGNIGVLLLSIVMIAFSGLFFGFVYWTMDQTQTAFESNDCVIDNNGIVSSCQDLWDLSLYPFLELKEILIWLSIFFIFTLALSLLLLGYMSGFNPIATGLLVFAEMLITYGSIYIANVYRVLVANATIRDMLVDFTVYNKVMLNFPWFVFVVSLFSIALGLVNWQRTRTNSSTSDLNY